MNCDPNELSKSASCYLCLPDDVLSAAKTSLLCSWANAVSGGGGGAELRVTENGIQLITEGGTDRETE